MKSTIIKSVSFYLFLLILVTGSSSVNAQAKQDKPVFVLVHGAWHGGWSWQKVSANLRAKGDIVYTPTLSGLGEHKNTANNDIDLNTHITDIVNLIVMEDLHNVILVGHSYAGVVIAGVADRIPERLNKLVYLDAMLVENGKSALGVQSKETQEGFAKLMKQTDQGTVVPALPADFFGVQSPEDIKWVNDRLTAQPYKTFNQPLTLNHPYGNHLPLIYIACINPVLPGLDVFAKRTKESKDWKYYELNTGHDAMITMPDELAAMLESFK